MDVVGILSQSKNPSQYQRTLKSRITSESNETICNKLKMLANDGKMRKTDVATKQQLFRIIQSIPSPNAEPFKQWLSELVINMLGEMATTEISKVENPDGFEESKTVAIDGGTIAGNARRELEARTGKKIVSSKNAKDPKLLDEKFN